MSNNPTQESLNTAVLFLVFNRPVVTAQVFDAIRRARPTRLYIAADGPRPGNEMDSSNVSSVRKIVASVDWECELKTLFRTENLGCKKAVSEAISWFFSAEEDGIILEDDCLPAHTFFAYCEKMLSIYRSRPDVWMVCGYSPRHPGINTAKCFLSNNPSVWGWATWRDRWKSYSVDLKEWPDDNLIIYLKDTFPKDVYDYYIQSFSGVKSGHINTWDYQLTYLILKNRGYVVKPYANLIMNIGVEGTHASRKDKNHFVRLGQFRVDSDSYYTEVGIDKKEDEWFYRSRISRGFFRRGISKILKLIRKI